MEKVIKIVLDPNTGKTNKYIDIIVEGLKGQNVEVYSFKAFFTNFRLFFAIKIFHLNWYENIDVTTDFIKKVSKLFLLKALGKKVIWTMHNRTPHSQDNIWMKKKLIYFLFKLSNQIIVHCQDSFEVIKEMGYSSCLKKTIYVPHPNYIAAYSDNSLSEITTRQDDVLSLLFVGAIKPYKNIELLIDVFKSLNVDCQLFIHGKCNSSSYASKLRDYAFGYKNINLALDFIPDNEIASLILKSDLLILPYDLRSSLNSGSVILAFSYGRSVICPKIGTINDYKHVDNLMFSYAYKDELSHFDNLKAKIIQAYNLKKKSPTALYTYGDKLKREVQSLNDNQKIIEKLSLIYKKVMLYC